MGTADARGWFSPRVKKILNGFAVLISLLSADHAIAATTRLDCSLTELETKEGTKTDFKTESRIITVIVDEDAKMITVDQDGVEQRLKHVTITQTALNGYNEELSLGIDASSGGVVLQTYKPVSMIAEFGVCRHGTKQLP
jgi:hypothetical protein